MDDPRFSHIATDPRFKVYNNYYIYIVYIRAWIFGGMTFLCVWMLCKNLFFRLFRERFGKSKWILVLIQFLRTKSLKQTVSYPVHGSYCQNLALKFDPFNLYPSHLQIMWTREAARSSNPRPRTSRNTMTWTRKVQL